MKNRLSKKKTPKAAKRPKRPPAEKAKSTRGRLLLVEDHEPTRNAIKALLAARKFDVIAAATVAEAWAFVKKVKFDLLVSDIGLPDGDGYLLMREFQDRYGLKGIALTGYGLDDDIKLSKEAGFSAHIVKPVRIGILDETLASLGI